jgi:two-component system nitrogen regulation sensor histidine kinase GlnL
MYDLKFTVCRNLIIRSVTMLRGGAGDKFAAGMVGHPYQRFFPIFLEGGDDAVQTVLREGTPMFLQGYQTVCFCGNVLADISITPLNDGNGLVSGAEITREVVSKSGRTDTIWKERRLVDIGRSSAALAHGVRNPLNAIKGAVVYLKDTLSDDPTLVEFAGIIEEEISKLDGFITRFLSTSLLESKFDTLDVNEMLRRILAVSKFQAYAKKISFVTEFNSLPLVRADVFQLEHAVMNVVNNALEAMAEGGEVRLKTETARREQRDYVRISISDNGGGMAREVLPENPDSPDGREPGKGRGFGLFLTREIVRLHDGLFEIVSRKNLGTSVAIYLPVV